MSNKTETLNVLYQMLIDKTEAYQKVKSDRFRIFLSDEIRAIKKRISEVQDYEEL